MDLPNNNNISTGIATLVTTIVMKKYKFNPALYGVIFVLITSLLNYAISYNLTEVAKTTTNNFTDKAIYVSIFMSICAVMFYYDFIGFIKRFIIKTPKEYTLYDITTIATFAKYMEKYPGNFIGDYNIRIGHSTVTNAMMDTGGTTLKISRYLSLINTTPIPDVATEIGIKDQKYNFTGKMKWKNRDIELKVRGSSGKSDETFDSIVKFKYITFQSDAGKVVDIAKYIENVIHHMNCEVHLKLASYKVIKAYYDKNNALDNDVSFIANYKIIGDLLTYKMKDMEKRYIDSFFHPNKDQLWNSFKKIKTDPESFFKYGQIPCKNMLAYGPPGTGKSTFGYRIAQALGRNIVEVDIRIIKQKQALYALFETPKFINDNCSGQLSAHNVVYILDEFDRTIEYLYEKQEEKKEAEKLYKENLKQYSLHSDFNMTEISYLKNCTKGSDMSEKMKNDSDKKENKIGSVCPEDIVLKDLLDVLQGPVPVEGRIIVATTNNYVKIKELCPALFRPGRMTPVHFNYPTKELIENITKYYFDREIDITLPTELETPTSTIIDLCLDAQTESNPYGFFIDGLSKLIKQVRS